MKAKKDVNPTEQAEQRQDMDLDSSDELEKGLRSCSAEQQDLTGAVRGQ